MLLLSCASMSNMTSAINSNITTWVQPMQTTILLVLGQWAAAENMKHSVSFADSQLLQCLTFLAGCTVASSSTKVVGCWISCSHSRMLLLAWSLEPENSTASHLWCGNFTGYQSVLVLKCLHGLAAEYLSEYCKMTTGRSHLRSANACMLSVPRTRTTYCDRSFAVSGPVAWNSLPVALRSSDITEETFRRHLKTFLFNCLDV